MNNLLSTSDSFIDRLANFTRLLTDENSEIPLAHILLISRVLFAVVMIGFIGYYYDRLKDSLTPAQSHKKAKYGHHDWR